jgi:two-component system sensor histidine kinase YesM
MFNDYSFILDEDWVKASVTYRGHITWSLFAPSFVQRENERYISLARSILYPAFTGERLATLLISINQREINTMLTRNDMDADFIRVCTEDTGEDVFMTDTGDAVGPEDIRRILRENGGTGSGGRLCEISGERYLLSYYTLTSPFTFNGQRLVVLYFTNYRRIAGSLSALSRMINFRMLIFLMILAGIIGIISRTNAKPIRALEEKVNLFTQTREIGAFNTARRDEIGDLSRAFGDMEVRINELFDQLRRESEIREQYHFQALRAQINPHFLFNTLNTIRWMAGIRKADNIVDTINALSKILDYSMSRTGELSALKDELEMIRGYVHIQNYRYGEDLEAGIHIEKETEDCRIIKFILQPIVENSFIHAFKNVRGKKILLITGRREENRLKLFVRDNGRAMTGERLAELRELLEGDSPEAETGIGLLNVHRRIRAAYGEGFGLTLESGTGEGTTVEYTLPLLNNSIEGGTN